MQAIGITPRQPHSACLVELPMPQLEEVPDGRGVLVKVLQVGMDGIDKELYLGEYGAALDGVEDPVYLVRVPGGLKYIGVLLEPMSIVQHARLRT